MQQCVFETEHRRRTDNGCLRVDGACDLLANALRAVEFGRRVGVGVVGRDVDVAVDIVLGDGLDDAFGTFDVYVCEGEVLRWPVAADKVVDDVRMADTFFDRLCVTEVVFLKS